MMNYARDLRSEQIIGRATRELAELLPFIFFMLRLTTWDAQKMFDPSCSY
jgi:hypothetical protein